MATEVESDAGLVEVMLDEEARKRRRIVEKSGRRRVVTYFDKEDEAYEPGRDVRTRPEFWWWRCG